jgi:hypothetical protein
MSRPFARRFRTLFNLAMSPSLKASGMAVEINGQGFARM